MKKYIKETYKNKLVSILLLLVGIISINPLFNNIGINGKPDGTAFILILIIAIPLFFSKKNQISWEI